VGNTYRTTLDLPDFAAGLDLSGAWGIAVEVLVGLSCGFLLFSSVESYIHTEEGS
jgi:hypothetical protein